MRSDLLALPLAIICSGCFTAQPTKSIATPVQPPGPEYTSTAARQPPRPIYDHNVAPAQYYIRPLAEWTPQETAADALGRIGPPAVPSLIEALKSPDPEARLQAAQVLARMGSDAKEAVPDLIRLLDDPDERIRKAATRALGRIGPDAAAAVPALMRTLLEPRPDAQPPR
jgi:hypothetical protein